ncbi:pseudouridine synthase [Microbacterium sp. CH12i]|uniref:pseudouridine synthase n=1 Tax=Microbacterium sp. CH12i TaxID=1479651 RepID=UPI00190F4D3F|nr:pseudouridine synthase [Microbacterium sp. CH12i]
MRSPLPVRDGVGATRLHVPRTGPWPTVSAYMVERFFHLEPKWLLERFDRGEIVAFDGTPVRRDTPLSGEEFVWYYREPPAEAEIPFYSEILYQDDDLVVIDKPHFLPTTPAGKYVQNSALVRLRRQLDNADLAPIHRLDRATAGLLMFSVRPQTRGAYQLLFQKRRIEKVYEAVSARPEGWENPFPLTVHAHIEKLRAQVCVEVDPTREPNSETAIELINADDHVIHTLLKPRTGKMHQLRVHLASVGAGILNDGLYPLLLDEKPDDHEHPLQLLAKELRFTDPLSGEEREFVSRRTLQYAPRI